MEFRFLLLIGSGGRKLKRELREIRIMKFINDILTI